VMVLVDFFTADCANHEEQAQADEIDDGFHMQQFRFSLHTAYVRTANRPVGLRPEYLLA
jgi:hypothetical protein